MSMNWDCWRFKKLMPIFENSYNLFFVLSNFFCWFRQQLKIGCLKIIRITSTRLIGFQPCSEPSKLLPTIVEALWGNIWVWQFLSFTIFELGDFWVWQNFWVWQFLSLAIFNFGKKNYCVFLANAIFLCIEFLWGMICSRNEVSQLLLGKNSPTIKLPNWPPPNKTHLHQMSLTGPVTFCHEKSNKDQNLKIATQVHTSAKFRLERQRGD